jgi:hypothetical protein
MNTTSTENETEKMIRAGAFNPDDLMFNQMGELSPRQRRWLKFEMAARVGQMMISLILMIAAWVGFYLQFQATSSFFFGGIFLSVLFLISIWMSVENMLPIWRCLNTNEVKSVAGTVSKRSAFQYPGRTQRALGYWALVIRSDTFSTNARIFNVITDRHSYRIFYIPALKRLVNIEPVHSEDQQKQSALAALQAHAKEKEQSHD